ncbi:MAG: lipid-binding SYLF domain-containing protein [Myxococcota bacterium]|nr:lipid-binding SYLF domain-containing protein [Myxococcota bacterium]
MSGVVNDPIRVARALAALLLAALLLHPAGSPPASAAGGSGLSRDARAALDKLYRRNPAARDLGNRARAVLVFPRMLKAGFMFGGQIGEGALLKGDTTAGYYNSVAASYGFQAGAQVFGYALFFMNDGALRFLDRSGGFELGVGPSVVVLDEGFGKSYTSSTLTQDIYALIFDQTGAMAGAGIQGSKITRISK